jgi:hypothetical protein
LTALAVRGYDSDHRKRWFEFPTQTFEKEIMNSARIPHILPRLLALVVPLVAVHASALAITLAPGAAATFNVDASSALPYQIAAVGAVLNQTPGHFTLSGFTEFNGGGLQIGPFPIDCNLAGGCGASADMPPDAGFLDGYFSMSIANLGTGQITPEVFAQVRVNGIGIRIEPVLANPVPEPSSFLLFLAGALGVLHSRCLVRKDVTDAMFPAK